jgi:hypothetical protein
MLRIYFIEICSGLVDNELEDIRYKAVVVYFKVVSTSSLSEMWKTTKALKN